MAAKIRKGDKVMVITGRVREVRRDIARIKTIAAQKRAGAKAK